MRTKYYAYDRWVSLFIVTCVSILFSALTHIIHKPTFAP